MERVRKFLSWVWNHKVYSIFLSILIALFCVLFLLYLAPEPLSQWMWNILISADQFLNTLFFGDPDETISSRMGKWMTEEVSVFKKTFADGLCWFLDLFDADHCVKSIDPTEGSDEIF